MKESVKFPNQEINLNASRFFHFAENLNLDAMHDFLEGFTPFSIKLVMDALSLMYPELGVNADFVNQRIQNFGFSFYDLPNKPSAKFTNDNIKTSGNYSSRQRAGQNFCLLNMVDL